MNTKQEDLKTRTCSWIEDLWSTRFYRDCRFVPAAASSSSSSCSGFHSDSYSIQFPVLFLSRRWLVHPSQRDCSECRVVYGTLDKKVDTMQVEHVASSWWTGKGRRSSQCRRWWDEVGKMNDSPELICVFMNYCRRAWRWLCSWFIRSGRFGRAWRMFFCQARIRFNQRIQRQIFHNFIHLRKQSRNLILNCTGTPFIHVWRMCL